MKTIKVKKLPKKVFKKAKILGNVFEELSALKRAMKTIEKIASINNEDEHNGVLTDIYKIAHAFIGNCSNPHDNWKEFENLMAEKLKDY